ncbi:MAG: hypothetical protein D6784_13670, partial [Chloroflexi bacterium]
MILLLMVYQLIRLVAFIEVYGGIEHDGGWMLSISRSLAEQGTYTTMVSTIVDPTVIGGIDVDRKFNIQAADGRIWFFTGNGIGPGSIIPDAVIIWLFGSGFWALRAGPLLFYLLFLGLGSLILYRLSGLPAVLLWHAFLFFYPHLSVFLGYEAMGEVPTMVYILGAYLLLAGAMAHSEARPRHFFLAGVVGGLAINTKLIALWSVGGAGLAAVVPWLMGRYRQYRRQRAVNPGLTFKKLSLWGIGVLSVLGLWEAVHLVILNWLAGFEMYRQHTWQRFQFVLDDGSGVGLRIHSGPEFFWDKFFLLSEVTHPQRPIVAILFVFLLVGGGWLIWRRWGEIYAQTLVISIWGGWLLNTIWFVTLAKTGWPRHFWFGMVLATMLLSLLGSELLKTYPVALRRSWQQWGTWGIRVTFWILILWSFAGQQYVRSFFISDEIVPYWQQKQHENKYDASLPWVLIPRQQQQAVVDYINQMPAEAHVYYPANHKVAEIPPQTGRLHYPLNRRQFMNQHPADIVVIGPSLVS